MVPPERIPYAAGLFSVVKDLERDRLILDARPANLLETPPQFWTSTLASSACLLSITLRPDQTLKISTADLKDFFYLFKATPSRLQRNLLKGSLTRAEAYFVFGRDCSAFADARGRVRVSLSTLAMGDCGACEYAQGSHLGVLFAHQVLSSHELLLPGFPPPRGLLSIGVVIDDLVILEKVTRAATSEAGALRREGGRRLEKAHLAYEEACLVANRKKGVQDADRASFWGVDLDGTRGLVRTNPARLWALCFVTARVASLGLISYGLLESLVGSWTSVFLLRRRCLSLLDHCYTVLQSCTPGQIIRMSGGFKDELWSLVALGPLTAANLKAPVLDCLFATDASDDYLACVKADLPPPVAEELLRHTLMKGAWARLLPAPQAWLRSKGMMDDLSELPDGGAFTHPLWRKMARALRYDLQWSREARRSQHINLKELLAFLRLEEQVGARVCSARILCAMDSQVCLGALVKGRASSPGLNRLLRRSLPVHLGSDLYSCLSFFKSEDGTRGRLTRRPCEPLPEWFGALANGRSLELDAWLASQPDYVLEASDTACSPASVERRLESVCPKPAPKEPRQPPSHFGLTNGRARRARLRRLRQATGRRPSSSLVSAPLDFANGDAMPALSNLPRQQFLPAAGPLDLASPGYLDLFTGKAGIARRLVKLGAPWSLTWEIERSVEEDLDRPSNRKLIALLIRGNMFRAFGAAPVCSYFSRAVHPACRSAESPLGLAHLPALAYEKVKKGNSQARWTGNMEQPDGSFMWFIPELRPYKDPASDEVYRVDACRHGARWRKRTRFATNTALGGVREFCRCKGPHLVLRGRSPYHNMSWTRVAQAYPASLCLKVARAVALKAGWLDREHGGQPLAQVQHSLKGPLNTSIARQTHARPGEASNPGPRASRFPAESRVGGLESRPLLTQATLDLGDKCWDGFLLWASSRLSFDLSLVFGRSPALLAMALRAYGNWLYCSGGKLHHLRHTILAGQRRFMSLKPYAGIVWELVTRWEHAEPPKHRTPIPLPLCQALVSIAWCSGYVNFAGAVLLAYFGLGRIGEVLKTLRSDLSLPGEDLWEQGGSAFLRLGTSKTATRGRPRVQHLKISDATAVQLLQIAFAKLPPTARLYPYSSSAFRYRWDKLLGLLGITKQARLTPGGLRGGGAVQSYRDGIRIGEIQFQMRLKHMHTLEFYIQETAAISALSQLSDTASIRVRAAAQVFQFLGTSA